MMRMGTASLNPLAISWYEGEGGLWFNRKVLVHPRFELGLRVEINEYGCYDPDSDALDGWTIILSKTNNYLYGPGGSIGYQGIYDALVTEVDLYYNQEHGDLSGNTISVHKCYKKACAPTEGSDTVQRNLPLSYDKCRRMVYDVVIIYSSGYFTVQLGDNPMVSFQENLGSKFDQNWAYVGFTGFFRGRRRDLQIAGSYLCEDDYNNNSFYYTFLGSSTLVLSQTNPAIMPAGNSGTFTIRFTDITGAAVPHTLGLDMWTWNFTLTSPCGSVSSLTTLDDYRLQFIVSNCNKVGDYNIIFQTDKGTAPAIPYRIAARSFDVLQFVAYEGRSATEATVTKIDILDGFYKFNWGTLNGDFSLDEFSVSKGLSFEVNSMDSFGNIFQLGTDPTTIASRLGLSVTNSLRTITPSISVVSNGRYRIFIPITFLGTYIIKSTKFPLPSDKRYKFNVMQGRPVTTKSICTMQGYTSTPTLDVGISVKIICQVYDQGGNLISPTFAQNNYGYRFGSKLVVVNYEGKTSQSDISCTNMSDNYFCVTSSIGNGKFTFVPYFQTRELTQVNIPTQLDTFYVQPTPSDINRVKVYDYGTNSFLGLTNRVATVNYVSSASTLTLLEFLDTDGTPFSAIGYPSTFNKSTITGTIFCTHDPITKLTVRIDFVSLQNKNYVGVYLDDKTFIKRSSHQYNLQLTYRNASINVMFNINLGNTNGRLVCIHPIGYDKTQWLPVSSTGSIQTAVNSDIVLGQVVLNTQDGFLYNYKLSSLSLLTITVTPQDTSTKVYVIENVNVDGFYNLRLTSNKVDTYKVTLSIGGVTVVNSYTVNVVPEPLINSPEATTMNNIDLNRSTATEKYLKTSFTTDEIPTFYFNSFDDYRNQLNVNPDGTNNFLGVKFSFSVNGNPVDVTYDKLSFSYDTTKSAYTLKDSYKLVGDCVLTITSQFKKTLSFYYTKNPGKVNINTSYASLTTSKNLKISQSASMLINLKDFFGINIPIVESLGTAAVSSLTVTAEAPGVQIINFKFVEISQLAYRYTTDSILKAGTYTVKITYIEPSNKESKIIPCNDCVFFVNYDQFEIAKCKLSAILSQTIQMSTNSILQVNNQVDKPLFNFNFYDTNNNQLQFVDQTSKLKLVFSGDNINYVLTLDWIGNNQILWTFPESVNLKDIKGGNYYLSLSYNEIVSQKYTLQFLGDGQDSDAGNGDPNFDLTFFSTTDVRPTAGINTNFNIQFRTADNLRVNKLGDLNLFKFTNSRVPSADKFKASVQYGAKKGDYIITINSVVSSSSTEPIILTIYYNGIQLKQTVNVIVKSGDLQKFEVSTGSVADMNTFTLNGIKTIESSTVTLTPFDIYGNIFDDLFNPSVFSIDRIVRLFSVQHSDNSNIVTSVVTNVSMKTIDLIITSRNVGTVALSSSFLTNTWKITVTSGPISTDFTSGGFKTDITNFIAGSQAAFYVYPRDQYNNVINSQQLTANDFSLIELSIIQPLQASILPSPVKNKFDDFSIEFKITLTEAGITSFVPKIGESPISCMACQITVQLAPYVFSKSRLFIGQYEMVPATPFDLNKGNLPNFVMVLYDTYGNKYDSVPSDMPFEVVFSGNLSNVKFCYEIVNDYISFYPCQDSVNLKNWMFLVSQSGYSLQLSSGNNSVTYKINLVGGTSDADASNGQIDVNKTFFNPTTLTTTAGNIATFMIEIRTTDGKRKNYWYDNPNDQIKLSFTQEGNWYTSEVALGEKPGQYSIKVSSTKAFTTNDNNRIFVKIEEIKCNINSVLFVVNPGTPVQAAFIDTKGLEIPRGSLPNGSTESNYVISLRLYDSYKNPVDAATKYFQYTATTTAAKAQTSTGSFATNFAKSVAVSSTLVKNSDNSLTLTVNSNYSGTYKITSSLLGESYTFEVLPGAPSALNSLVKTPAKATAGDNVKIYLIPFDAYSNYINPTSKGVTNNFVVTYKYKDASGNFVDYVQLSNFTIEPYPGDDMGCKNCNAYTYNLQLKVRGQNYFRVTLGASAEIKCVNCMTDVAPGPVTFSQYDFRRYDSLTGKFISLQDGANEDNSKVDIIYRVYPRDNFLNKIDSLIDSIRYSVTLTDKDGKTYTLKNMTPNGYPQEYVEFVKNDGNIINKDLTYNTLTGGSYTATFSYTVINTEIVKKNIVLIGRDGDNLASNQDIEEQNTVINEANLNFNAGQSGNLLIELRTINNLRKNNWNQKVEISYLIKDASGNTLTGEAGQDLSFYANVRNAGVLGVFYATVSSILATTTLKDRRLVLQIKVNGKIVSRLSPEVRVNPASMAKASILSTYLIDLQPYKLKEGDADTQKFFKVSAFDIYGNPTPCDPLALKLSALGPDKNPVSITSGREVTTGYSTYTLDSKLSGLYTIASDSGILTTYTFINNSGKLVPENTNIVVNDKSIVAGGRAYINITPRDKNKNNISPTTVSMKYLVEIYSPSGKKINTDYNLVSANGNDLVFSQALSEKGIHTWRVLINSQIANCENCQTTVTPSVPVPKNSKIYCENAGGVMTYYSNNSELSRSADNPLAITVALVDLYGNVIDSVPIDVAIKSPIMNGKNMNTLVFDTSRTSDNSKFYVSVPSDKQKTFKQLVSGLYNLAFVIDRKGEVAQFNYKVNLTSGKIDSGYGNGNYAIEQTEISVSSLLLYADTTSTINMKLKTGERLYYNDDIDLTKDVTYSISPKDDSFKFKIYKKGLNYGDYNIDVYSSKSQVDSQLKLTISLRDPLDTNVFKPIPTVVTIIIRPRVPPAADRTLILSKPESSIKPDTSITITFKLYDNFGNVYVRNTDIVNNLIVTNNNILVTNSAIQLKNDGETYEVSFIPAYPPRNCEINIFYKDSKQQVSIIPALIRTKIESDPFYPNTIVSGTNMNEMNAGSKLDLAVTFYDKNNVCMDNVDNIPVSATVNGPLEKDDVNRINFAIKFKLQVIESNDSAACTKSWIVDIPDNQIYNAIGTYKIIIKVGESGYEAKSFNQKVTADVLDIKKFVSRYQMAGDFNSGRIPAGTEILFSIQGNDKFMNPVKSSILNDFSINLVSKSGKIAVSDKDSSTKFDYSILLSENTNGLINGSLKIFTANNYIVQYLYKGSSLNSIDASRGPFDINIVPQSCSPKNPTVIVDKLAKATTSSPTYLDVKCKDVYGNVINTGGEIFRIFITVNIEQSKTSTDVKSKLTDNNDGSYRVEFVPPLSGTYNLIIDLKGDIYYTYKFPIKDNVCPKETPNRCPNNSEKCVANLVDCIENRGSCTTDAPFFCKVNGKETCVKSQTECDCPAGMTKCFPNICVPSNKEYMCSFSLPISCSKLFPRAKVLCPDGICRASINDCPSQKVCPIGFFLCPDLTCRDDISKCAPYDDCPKKSMIRCPDQTCVNDQKECPIHALHKILFNSKKNVFYFNLIFYFILNY
jgi:hypothetical protein